MTQVLYKYPDCLVRLVLFIQLFIELRTTIHKALLQVILHNVPNSSFLIPTSLHVPPIPLTSGLPAESTTPKIDHKDPNLASWVDVDNHVPWAYIVVPDTFRGVKVNYFHGFFADRLPLIFVGVQG